MRSWRADRAGIDIGERDLLLGSFARVVQHVDAGADPNAAARPDGLAALDPLVVHHRPVAAAEVFDHDVLALGAHLDARVVARAGYVLDHDVAVPCPPERVGVLGLELDPAARNSLKADHVSSPSGSLNLSDAIPMFDRHLTVWGLGQRTGRHTSRIRAGLPASLQFHS
jgi:hypothetical protein